MLRRWLPNDSAYRRNHDSEHDALDQACRDVVQYERIEGCLDVGAESESGFADAEKSAAQDTHEIGPGGQAGHHQDHGKEFWGDEKMHGIERHCFERVDFFVHLHRPDLGRERGTGTPDDDNCRHQRAKFAGHYDYDGIRDLVQGAKFAEFVGTLERENCSDEKRNQGNNGKGFDPDGHRLMNGPPEPELAAAEGCDENRAGRAARELRQAADVGQAIDRRFADRFG